MNTIPPEQLAAIREQLAATKRNLERDLCTEDERETLESILPDLELVLTAYDEQAAELAEASDFAVRFARRIDEQAKEIERLREALTEISNRPHRMIWGEDTEIQAAMKDMEKIADAALKEQQNEQ